MFLFFAKLGERYKEIEEESRCGFAYSAYIIGDTSQHVNGSVKFLHFSTETNQREK